MTLLMARPINEYKTPGLATPTSPGRQRAVTLAQSFKHLIRYADTLC